MTWTTEGLIDRLVADAAPVRRLLPPWQRGLVWLALAVAALGAGCAVWPLRADLTVMLGMLPFCACLCGAALTAALSAVAAFALSLPDRSRAWALLPLPAVALWFATLGISCARYWAPLGDGATVSAQLAAGGVTALAFGLPVAVGLLAMLRRSSLVITGAARLMAALAVGALTACALTVLHAVGASALILLANVGPVVLAAVVFGFWRPGRAMVATAG